MFNYSINNEQVKGFVYDIFDTLINDIKKMESAEQSEQSVVRVTANL